MSHTDLDPLKVTRAHDGALEVLDVREVTLEERVELEIGRAVLEEDALDVRVLAVLVQEVAQEVVHRLVVDVSAHHDVSVGATQNK